MLLVGEDLHFSLEMMYKLDVRPLLPEKVEFPTRKSQRRLRYTGGDSG